MARRHGAGGVAQGALGLPSPRRAWHGRLYGWAIQEQGPWFVPLYDIRDERYTVHFPVRESREA